MLFHVWGFLVNTRGVLCSVGKASLEEEQDVSQDTQGPMMSLTEIWVYCYGGFPLPECLDADISEMGFCIYSIVCLTYTLGDMVVKIFSTSCRFGIVITEVKSGLYRPKLIVLPLMMTLLFSRMWRVSGFLGLSMYSSLLIIFSETWKEGKSYSKANKASMDMVKFSLEEMTKLEEDCAVEGADFMVWSPLPYGAPFTCLLFLQMMMQCR